MHQERENLDIIFRKRTPEDVLEKIRLYYNGNIQKLFPYEMPSFVEYDYFGISNLVKYSGDEIRTRFEQLDSNCKKSDNSIFSLLYEYSNKVLEYRNLEPLCKMESVLNWNSITSRLGQDIFVTSWLSKHDYKYDKYRNDDYCWHSFDWPYCIRTNDMRLNAILETGLAENHMHLGGSTQSFPLSWAALMNHPKLIFKSVREGGRFKKNLVQGRSDFSEKNEERWTLLLRYAAYIRALLFERCVGIADSNAVLSDFRRYDRTQDNFQLIDTVEQLRMTYGAKVRLFGNCPCKCLDYAMSVNLYKVDLDGYNRLLAGERAFLYTCFLKMYHKDFGVLDKSLFYLYLLIKNNFRSELIQTNKRNGFYNFLQYQNRKGQFYPYIEYKAESQRLAVCASIKENHIRSMEARIMPGESMGKMAKRIMENDKLISIASPSDLDKMFYVTHFAKETYIREEVEEIKEGVLRPRNWKVRNKIYKQARAIYNFRLRYCEVRGGNIQSLQSRIHGIDACASEIGCRPETFATEFRFLRNCNVICNHKWYLNDFDGRKDLGITYHVGEDFLDICDGLRAVDEAVEFLELKNGDRIGHGLVLGMDPDKYYRDRQYNIYLTKQDYLDNCIWILFRTLEWNIYLDSSFREFLKQEALRLLDEIYGDIKPGQNTGSLEMFYYSWHLRGDHPSLYRSGIYQEEKGYSVYPYNEYKECNDGYKMYRKDTCVSQLYYKYHFDRDVKEKGLDVISITIGPWYVELMKSIQEYMRCHRISENGIAIECNPTSNKLIGYFGAYDQHPILKFNDYLLNSSSIRQQIIVSINTDDLGVFDTSLCYEYALLFSAIRKKRHKEGNYNDEQIYAYLQYIIENGFKIVF